MQFYLPEGNNAAIVSDRHVSLVWRAEGLDSLQNLYCIWTVRDAWPASALILAARIVAHFVKRNRHKFDF